jgi:hypothetical protein
MGKLYSNPVLFTCLKTVFYSFMLILIWWLMVLDSQVSGENPDGKFGETSFTEFAQEIFLLLSGVLYLTIANRYLNVRGYAILLAGFCFTTLIREYNNYFYDWFKGAWQLFALIISSITVFFAFRNRTTILKPLRKYLKTPAFGISISGLLIIMVFSRLFGLHGIWRNILEEELLGRYRWVKNAVEEGTELLGYTLFFFGAVEYFFQLHKKQQRRTTVGSLNPSS